MQGRRLLRAPRAYLCSSAGTGAVPLPQRWLEAATKELRGADVSKLPRQTAEGIPLKPLYTAADLPSGGAEKATGLPGEFPYARG